MGNQQPESIDVRVEAGRRSAWFAFLLPLIVTAVFGAIGASRYAGMPDVIPTHWAANGVADAYGEKSFWTVFGPLMIGPALTAFFAFAAWATSAMVPPEPDQSAWKQYQREGSRRATILALALCATLVALLVGTISDAAWRQQGSFQPWPVVAFIILVLVVILASYPIGQRWARRRAAAAGVEPAPEERAEDARWVAGGLYKDDGDPRLLVPKREGHGVGTTLNLGSPGGRAIALAFLALVLAVPAALVLLPLLG